MLMYAPCANSDTAMICVWGCGVWGVVGWGGQTKRMCGYVAAAPLQPGNVQLDEMDDTLVGDLLTLMEETGGRLRRLVCFCLCRGWIGGSGVDGRWLLNVHHGQAALCGL